MGEIYIKLSVQFPNDSKVRALARYGADAGLARDLYVQMCLYCKDMLSDGLVPVEQIGLLVYPLDVEHGNQLAKQLASVGLIKELSKGETQCWEILAYVKRNGTRSDVERLSQLRAEAGRSGGRSGHGTAGQGTRKANAKQVAKQGKSKEDPIDRDRVIDKEEKENDSLKRADVGSDLDPDFVTFWDVYPRCGTAATKAGKGQARTQWRKAVLTNHADPKAIIVAAERFRDFHAAAGTEPRYIAYASTWLNGERYNEEEPEIDDGSGSGRRISYPTSPWAQ